MLMLLLVMNPLVRLSSQKDLPEYKEGESTTTTRKFQKKIYHAVAKVLQTIPLSQDSTIVEIFQ